MSDGSGRKRRLPRSTPSLAAGPDPRQAARGSGRSMTRSTSFGRRRIRTMNRAGGGSCGASWARGSKSDDDAGLLQAIRRIFHASLKRSAPLRLYRSRHKDAPAFLPNVEAAPAFGQERRSTDLIVPLGYCRLISNAFFEFEI